MKRISYLLALLVVLFSTASAQYVEPWGATRALRMKEAAKLHDELYAMYNQIPSLSPAEQKWLDGELNSGNGKITERTIRATDSQEYAVSTAKSGFALVLMPLNNVRLPNVACKDEVLMWIEVASRLPDGELWQAVNQLVERKIVSKKSADDFGHSFLAGNATLRSQAILNAVVIPYLRGDLNCQ